MIYEMLDKLEKNHPTLYVITMLIIFFLGCSFFAGLAILAKYITTII